MTRKNPIVHIHIPKTGGTWLNATLNDILPPHEFPFPNVGHLAIGYTLGSTNSIDVTAKHHINGQTVDFAIYPSTEIKRPELYQRSIKLSVCRNPFDLLASYYFHNWGRPDNAHLANLQEDDPVGWDNINVIHGIKSFDGFIKRYCDPDFKWWHVPRKRHLFFQMFEASGKCGVNVILRHERMYEGLSFFLTHYDYCGISALEKHKHRESNATTHKNKDYRSYYTDELRGLVETKCAEELQQYHYNFDGSTTDDVYVDPEDIQISWNYSKPG